MPDPALPTSFDAVVLAGGRGSRLGGSSKPEVVVGGRALLDHALDAVTDAARTVIVGPPSVARPGVRTVLEDPPDGGPVAGLAAGLAALGSSSCELVAVLACDVPRAGGALRALLDAAAVDGVDGARLVSTEGRPQHLVAVYRSSALAAAVERLTTVQGASMRALVSELVLVDVLDVDDSGADADTWADVERLDALLSREATATERIEP
ncbi:molybdenum cofactor guanylyltransferase [Cellulomonas sp. URHE0023]|uniref:molybdenum cofactor guanylyltransferase n=1 Tax=Cellulomonas sp. URHE0023 TaxID=1380354 RepID=UPI00054F5F01|nr:NTP transferase domain-containing protein [Cellulomonas sp. URHE0023]